MRSLLLLSSLALPSSPHPSRIPVFPGLSTLSSYHSTTTSTFSSTSPQHFLTSTRAVLPLAEGSLRDALTEMCCFYMRRTFRLS
ncbi:hypothetical protein F5888DRAFT_1717332 [Russula emetica]|nr:hypothetical protein F5888DRAFT_1717332 [Russula emetica]